MRDYEFAVTITYADSSTCAAKLSRVCVNMLSDLNPNFGYFFGASKVCFGCKFHDVQRLEAFEYNPVLQVVFGHTFRTHW